MSSTRDLEAQLRHHFLAVADERSSVDTVLAILSRTQQVTPRRWDVGWRLPVIPRRIGLAVLLALLILALVALALGLGSRPTLPVEPPRAQNGWIAFATDGRAGEDLTVDSGDPRPQTHVTDIYVALDGVAHRLVGSPGDPLSQRCPAFSPDGTKLAYFEGAADALAGNQAQRPMSTAWTLVVVDYEDSGELGASEWRHPVRSEGPARPPCAKWAPSGDQLAYAWADGLHLVTVAGGDVIFVPSPVADFDWNAGDIAWAPDGTRLAYITGVIGQAHVWIVPTNGDPVQVVVGTGAESVDVVTWSPDGTRVAVLGHTWRLTAQTLASMEWFVRAASVGDADVETLEQGAESGPSALAWAPAPQLAYTRGRAIVLRSGDGEVGRVIQAQLLGIEPLLDLSWSPSGRELAFLGAVTPGGYAPVALPIDPAGDARPLAPATSGFYPPIEGEISWQPDLR